jgi:hypothetical protein
VVGYHGTKQLSTVLRDGLCVPAYEGWGCRIGHVCIAETPEIAAAFALGPDDGVSARTRPSCLRGIDVDLGARIRVRAEMPSRSGWCAAGPQTPLLIRYFRRSREQRGSTARARRFQLL